MVVSHRCLLACSGVWAPCLGIPPVLPPRPPPPPPPGQQLHGPAGQQEPLRAQHVHDRPSPGRRALFCWAAGWSMTCKTTPVRKCLKWGGVDASGSNATHGHPMLRQRVKPRRWAAAARRAAPNMHPLYIREVHHFALGRPWMLGREVCRSAWQSRVSLLCYPGVRPVHLFVSESQQTPARQPEESQRQTQAAF